jgi:hypothetical protein
MSAKSGNTVNRKRFHTIYSCLSLCIALAACVRSEPSSTPTASPYPTTTLRPSPTVTVTPSSTHSQPTLVPTIAAEKIPALLLSAFSIGTPEPVNGHPLRRITGWSNGYNSGKQENGFQGYQWMDADHLLLFPVVGQTQQPDWSTTFARAVVINLNTGKIWLPPDDQPDPGFRTLRILTPHWSPSLGVLIASEITGEGDAAQAGVTTYTPDDGFVARYAGRLESISPSGTKILVADDTWIDLGSGKSVDFGWGSGATEEKWSPVWSPDENRIYRCCYYYGNAKTGESYTISNDKTIFEGGPWEGGQSLHHTHGIWLTGNYVLAQFDGFYTYKDGFIPIFDTSARTFRNLGKLASVPDEFNDLPYVQPSISPKGDYMWLAPGLQPAIDPKGYLVDLRTFTSQLYPSGSLEWSGNGEYAIVGSQVLTLATKELRPLPAYPESAKGIFVDDDWDPAAGVLATIAADRTLRHQTLCLLDLKALAYQVVALPSEFSGDEYRPTVFWSPKGDRIALLAADNSVWVTDYPALQNLERITPPLPAVQDVLWSPDGAYLSLVSGPDIYIVGTRSTG